MKRLKSRVFKKCRKRGFRSNGKREGTTVQWQGLLTGYELDVVQRRCCDR
jgi:hypothetical protein